MTVSPDQIPAVRKALRATFATEALEGATPLSGGLSGARLWRIRVGGIAYLLRLETGRDAVRDPHRGYRCMSLAAEACLAPRVRYADADDGVAITEFVEARSLTLEYSGGRADLVVELAQAARALHAIEAFPSLTDYLDALNGLVDRAARSGTVSAEALAGPLTAWARLWAICANLAPQPVASHNDLNPRNLLYDGRRIWLIDWEAAFRADRYVDLSALANVFAPDPDSEALLLRTYFGREARPDERARLYLFRQVSHVFHAAAFLVGLTGQARAEHLDGPALDVLHQDLALGEPLLETPQGRLDYALARLRTATANIESPAFAQAARTAR